MQFRDLKKQYEVLKKDMDAAILEVAASSAYIMGTQVKELETALAEFVGMKHCVSCGNGTDALTLALKVWGIGHGDAVFVPDFTFFASAEVIPLEGATPVFVDVDKDTFNIDVAHLEKMIEKTIAEGKLTPKVIITVDLFGLPADYQAVRAIADKYNLLVLEDSAQGFGGNINGQRACSFGDIATTSFFPAKPLGCYGDGGALFTDNDEWADLADSYRVHGKGSFKYDNVRIGLNSRLDTVQAAVLLVKFKAFKEYELADVNKVAEKYTQKLKNSVKVPFIPDDYYSSWAQYTITLENSTQRDRVQNALKEAGVPTMIYYQTPMHAQTAFKELGYRDAEIQVASDLCHKVLSLPIHPYLKDEDIDLICKTILEAL